MNERNSVVISALRRRARRVGDWFLLKRAEATVRAYSGEQLAAIRRLHKGAGSHVALADETTDGFYAAAAVALHRDAVRLLVSALAIARGIEPSDTSLELPAALALLDELRERGEVPAFPRRYAEARATLEMPDHLTFDGKDGIDRARGRAAVELLTAWLRGLVEARNVPELWLSRVGRVMAGAGALAIVIRAVVAAVRMRHA